VIASVRALLIVTSSILLSSCAARPEAPLARTPGKSEQGPFSLIANAVEAVTLRVAQGGWGPSPTYTVTFRRSADALYEGRQKVRWIGQYRALLPSGAFSRLAQALANDPGLQRSDGFCFDAPPMTLTVITTAPDTLRAAAGCGAPEANRRIATLVDSLADHLPWTRLE
jgi:hypothetical protein